VRQRLRLWRRAQLGWVSITPPDTKPQHEGAYLCACRVGRDARIVDNWFRVAVGRPGTRTLWSDKVSCPGASGSCCYPRRAPAPHRVTKSFVTHSSQPLLIHGASMMRRPQSAAARGALDAYLEMTRVRKTAARSPAVHSQWADLQRSTALRRSLGGVELESDELILLSDSGEDPDAIMPARRSQDRRHRISAAAAIRTMCPRSQCRPSRRLKRLGRAAMASTQ